MTTRSVIPMALTLSVLTLVGLVTPSCGEETAADEPSGETQRVLIPVTDKTPRKLALLVGIGRYASGPDHASKVPDLPGPDHDMKLVQALLRDSFGFAEDDIVTLQHKRATHRNIVDVFHRHLIQKAGPETEVVFWFSGHGSRVPDLSNRESGGTDSTLLAYDSRAVDPNGSYDISDDEVRSLLQALSARTDRITIVTDNCHAGGVTRGQDDLDGDSLPSRGLSEAKAALDREKIRAFWPEAEVPFLDDDDPRIRDVSDRLVHIAACTKEQVARGWRVQDQDDDDGRPRHYGALTWFLVQALSHAGRDELWEHVFDRTQLLVSNHRPGQTPTSAGNLSRTVLGGDFKASLPDLKAFVVDADRLSVRGGTIQGLCVGSELDVHRQFGAKIGTARVEHVARNGVRAIARWIDKPGALEPNQPLRVVETSRPYNLPPLQVHTRDAGLRTLLTSSRWVDLVAEPDAHYVLSRTQDDRRLRLRDREGLQVWPTPTLESSKLPDKDDRLLTQILRGELRYQALMQFALEPGQLAVAAGFRTPTPRQLSGEAFGMTGDRRWKYQPAVLNSAAGERVYRGVVSADRTGDKQGDLTILRCTNKSEQDVYLYVVSLEEYRAPFLLWGDSDESQDVLRSGQYQDVPIVLVASPEWVLPRPMRDRYLVITTTKPLTKIKQMLHGSYQPTRADDQPVMPPLLQRAVEVAAAPTRGDTHNPTAPKGWGTTWVDVLVSHKQLDKR